MDSSTPTVRDILKRVLTDASLRLPLATRRQGARLIAAIVDCLQNRLDLSQLCRRFHLGIEQVCIEAQVQAGHSQLSPERAMQAADDSPSITNAHSTVGHESEAFNPVSGSRLCLSNGSASGIRLDRNVEDDGAGDQRLPTMINNPCIMTISFKFKHRTMRIAPFSLCGLVTTRRLHHVRADVREQCGVIVDEILTDRVLLEKALETVL
jgi:hypothetical protein